MTAKIETEHFCALPPQARHAITTHMPGWSNLLRFMDRDPTLMGSFKSMYPRMLIHKDIQQLTGAIVAKFGAKEGQACLFFPSLKSATECKAYATSDLRKEDKMDASDIEIRAFDVHQRIYGVFFPQPKFPIVHAFWMNAGVGMSSRMGEEGLKHVQPMTEAKLDSPAPPNMQSLVQDQVKERISELLKRAPAGPTTSVSPFDVYLYQTGMAAIYNVHQTLQNHFAGTSILYGFAFHSTIHIFEDWPCPGFKFFGSGDETDFKALEEYLENETKEGRKVQALWTEFPANPILVTPDLHGLRRLADKYGFALIIDDTVGSFANVDVLPMADILVTSLTKSFNGYADVMAASAVLNPSSGKYSELKALWDQAYADDLFAGDATALEANSRNYLERSHTLNNNAAKLVEYLQSEAANPASSVSKVYYPTVLPSLVNYTPFMRAKTDDFTPGYGCLFSVELDSIEAFQAMYENLNVHMGPHLGAHLTLALPYIKALYGKDLTQVSSYDLRETQLRIAVGLEDTEHLFAVFKEGVKAANKVKSAVGEKVLVDSLT